jgi:DNA-binding NarL/FixJ family response regulator
LESFRQCRTLILDRDILVCSLLQETLKLIGFRMVLTASRVDTAHRLIREAYCDLVLLDWPSHRFLLKALRGEHGPRRPIVVARGADRDPRHLLSSIKEGADAFINTPVSTAQMLITMKRLLIDFVPPARHMKLSSARALGESFQTDDRARECTILHGNFQGR